MHLGIGHISRFWLEVDKDVRRIMDGCQWQMRLEAIDSEIDEMRIIMNERLQGLLSNPLLKRLKDKIKMLNAKKSGSCSKLMMSMLEEEAEDHRERIRVRSENLGIVSVNLILGGLEELEEVLKENKKEITKRQRSDLQFVLWKTIETRLQGKLNPKQSHATLSL